MAARKKRPTKRKRGAKRSKTQTEKRAHRSDECRIVRVTARVIDDPTAQHRQQKPGNQMKFAEEIPSAPALERTISDEASAQSWEEFCTKERHRRGALTRRISDSTRAALKAASDGLFEDFDEFEIEKEWPIGGEADRADKVMHAIDWLLSGTEHYDEGLGDPLSTILRSFFEDDGDIDGEAFKNRDELIAEHVARIEREEAYRRVQGFGTWREPGQSDEEHKSNIRLTEKLGAMCEVRDNLRVLRRRGYK
jgi:hypothetical protein